MPSVRPPPKILDKPKIRKIQSVEWYEYFCTTQPKSRELTSYLTQFYVYMDHYYSFLHGSQVRGKVYDELGIPNVCGAVDKAKLKKMVAKTRMNVPKKRTVREPSTATSWKQKKVGADVQESETSDRRTRSNQNRGNTSKKSTAKNVQLGKSQAEPLEAGWNRAAAFRASLGTEPVKEKVPPTIMDDSSVLVATPPPAKRVAFHDEVETRFISPPSSDPPTPLLSQSSSDSGNDMDAGFIGSQNSFSSQASSESVIGPSPNEPPSKQLESLSLQEPPQPMELDSDTWQALPSTIDRSDSESETEDLDTATSSVQSTPVQGSPVQSSPVQSFPLQSSPVHSSLVRGSTPHESPVRGFPDQDSPFRGSSDQDSPVQGSPDHSCSIHSSPVHSSPDHSSPVHSSPVHSSPDHSSPNQESPVQGSPLQRPPSHKIPMQPPTTIGSPKTSKTPSSSPASPSSFDDSKSDSSDHPIENTPVAPVINEPSNLPGFREAFGKTAYDMWTEEQKSFPDDDFRPSEDDLATSESSSHVGGNMETLTMSLQPESEIQTSPSAYQRDVDMEMTGEETVELNIGARSKRESFSADSSSDIILGSQGQESPGLTLSTGAPMVLSSEDIISGTPTSPPSAPAHHLPVELCPSTPVCQDRSQRPVQSFVTDRLHQSAPRQVVKRLNFNSDSEDILEATPEKCPSVINLSLVASNSSTSATDWNRWKREVLEDESSEEDTKEISNRQSYSFVTGRLGVLRRSSPEFSFRAGMLVQPVSRALSELSLSNRPTHVQSPTTRPPSVQSLPTRPPNVQSLTTRPLKVHSLITRSVQSLPSRPPVVQPLPNRPPSVQSLPPSRPHRSHVASMKIYPRNPLTDFNPRVFHSLSICSRSSSLPDDSNQSPNSTIQTRRAFVKPTNPLDTQESSEESR